MYINREVVSCRDGCYSPPPQFLLLVWCCVLTRLWPGNLVCLHYLLTRVELSVSNSVQTNSAANLACCLVGTRGEWSEHEADCLALFSTANKTDRLYLLCLVHLHHHLFYLGLLVEKMTCWKYYWNVCCIIQYTALNPTNCTCNNK